MMKFSMFGGVVVLLATAGAAQATDWNGFYAGVVAGYTSTTTDTAYDQPGLAAYDVTADPKGYNAGVVMGANFVVDGPLLFGFEGEVGLADITDTIDDELGGSPETITVQTDYYATLRARFGLPLENFLPYATAGVNISHVNVSATEGNISDEGSVLGFTGGVGVEIALNDSMSVKLEYEHTETEDHTWFEGENWSSTGKGSSNTVRIGANFGF